MYHAVIVDDELLFLRYLTDRVDWQRYDIHVDGAYSSAQQALEYARSMPVDLVMTDIKMPGLNGIDLIHQLPSGVRMHAFILVLSGYDDFHLVREAFRAGASDYLLKSDVNTPAFDGIMKKALGYLNARAAGSEAFEDGGGMRLTAQIKEYVRQNLGRALPLGEIAAHFGFSPGYLSHLFSAREGMTLTDYITNMRISRAKQLLCREECSITEILYNVGFNSPEHFSRTFRKLTGMSPKEYREKSASGEEKR